jgi:hypothetical protein
MKLSDLILVGVIIAIIYLVRTPAPPDELDLSSFILPSETRTVYEWYRGVPIYLAYNQYGSGVGYFNHLEFGVWLIYSSGTFGSPGHCNVNLHAEIDRIITGMLY